MTFTANGLACERNGRLVFSGVSFSIGPGELTELRGPNGSGKSSLLRLIAGLVPAAAGTLQWHDGEIFEPARHCHYVGHHEALKNPLTVRENLAFWADMLDGALSNDALFGFSLQHLADEPVRLLSAGQRRRVALSRLLVAKRPVWLLDEPATALDRTSQQALSGLIDTHLETGGLVIAATHGDLPGKSDHVITLGQA